MGAQSPINASLRLLDPSAGRGDGQQASLKAGAFVSLVVKERLGPSPGFPAGTILYKVSVGGHLLKASSALNLEPGTTLRAKVDQAGNGLVLRLADAASRAALDRQGATLAASGLPNDQAARSALVALLRESVAPDPKALSRVRRAALRDSEDGSLTDLAAKMEAKGLGADAEALDELSALTDARLGGRGASGGASGGAGGEGQGESGDREGGQAENALETNPAKEWDPGIDLERDFLAEVDEVNLPRALAELIRGLATRSGETGEKLALFNHLRGKEGSWVILPFRFALDEVDFSGSFRLELPYLRGGQGRFEAYFSASRGSESEEWSFFASFGGARPTSLRLVTPSSCKIPAGKIQAFAAELAALSCSLRVSDRETGEGVDPSASGRRGGFDFDA
jgi:hypothetical protein